MSNITQPNTSINRCRKSVGYPNFTPIIYGASVTTSVSGVYTLVYITGENFISPVNGTTYVNFSNAVNTSYPGNPNSITYTIT